VLPEDDELDQHATEEVSLAANTLAICFRQGLSANSKKARHAGKFDLFGPVDHG